MSFANYIPDVNRFQLAGPPRWFLHQLGTFDPSLVVVPSRQGFYYRLAQRRKLQLPVHIVNDALWNESDTQMLASYSLVPVTTIIATANWSNPYLFVELTNRAPWRLGGAAKVNAMLESQDRQDRLDKQVRIDDHLNYLAKDGWKHYRKKIGLGRAWNISPRSDATPPSRAPIRANRQFTGFSRSDLL